ncbi:hypothetical protein MUK72_19265 (plasmid) [Halococcus dombrowskii]|uniref:TrbC/VIRB2 family protein n=1 Tax=Halococcus dombrowskii TaxID=179637 RepID=A0AAV3SIJ6_HALDO|nr:hypothetical protein [Halococcus dombrowskii]UOO97292.1 hypothetical protein MUK72_19265 [Halococcus dombrowskii]
MSDTLADVQNQVASIKQVAYRKAPIPAALASWSFIGLERLGEKATSSRKGRMSLLSMGLMLVFAGPAAAQVSCKSGPLSFLSDIHSMITQGAGTIIVSMVLVAGVLKMIPMRGTNSWGNALVGSVIVGVLFLVIGPALVDLADQATDVNLDAQCTGGGGGGGEGGN